MKRRVQEGGVKGGGRLIILKVIAAEICNEINISGFDGGGRNSGLADAYHRDYY